MLSVWNEPWRTAAIDDTVRRKAFERELAMEVQPGHALYGVSTRLMALGDGDDCLFEILDGTGRIAEVHLVWQGPQTPPWPSAVIYENLEDWKTQSNA